MAWCVCVRLEVTTRRGCVVVGALDVGMQWFCRVIDPRTRRAHGSVGFNDEVVGALFGRMCSWMTSLPQLSSSSSLSSSGTSTGASGAAQSQPLGQPRPVKMSTLSATSVGVLLQYLLEANRIAGNVKMKQTPVKTAADDDGSAPFVAGVGGVVDAALKVFPVKGVRVQLTPGEGFVPCHVAPFATVLPCLSLNRRGGCCTSCRFVDQVRRLS